MNYKQKFLASAIAAIAGSGMLATSAIAESNQSDVTGFNPANPPLGTTSMTSSDSTLTINRTPDGGGTSSFQGEIPFSDSLSAGIIDIINASGFTGSGTGTTIGTGTGTNTATGTGTTTGTGTATGTSTDNNTEIASGTRRSTGLSDFPGSDSDPGTSTATGNLPDGDGSSSNGRDTAIGDNTNCNGDACQSAESETRKITLNDIAELIELDLEKSVEQLAAAEAAATAAESQPRRIVRRISLKGDDNRACVNPAIEARKTLQSKLEDSREFIEKVNNQFNYDNSLW